MKPADTTSQPGVPRSRTGRPGRFAGALTGDKVKLGGHQSHIARLVPATGRHDVTCTHFLHAGLGLVGSLTID